MTKQLRDNADRYEHSPVPLLNEHQALFGEGILKSATVRAHSSRCSSGLPLAS